MLVYVFYLNGHLLYLRPVKECDAFQTNFFCLKNINQLS